MNPFAAFILGLLAGWVVEWIIDWLYWRKRMASYQAAEQNCKETRQKLEDELAALRKEYETLRAEQTSTPMAELPTRAEPVEVVAPLPDKLQRIKGIGPVIEKKLNEAGIFTFEQLGEKDIHYLRGVLGDVIERLADEDSLLEQARQFAREKQQKG